MSGWIRGLWVRFVAWWRSSRLGGRRQLAPPAAEEFGVVHVNEDPDEPLSRTLYAVGEKGNLWHLVLVCPCGCGATIGLNALPDDSPRWSLFETPEGPTLTPSVWRTSGCKSHFLLRRGRVIWCGQETDAPR